MDFLSSTRARLFAAVLLSAMVAACGGGSAGGGEVSAPPPPAPVPPPPASQLLDWEAHPAATIVLGQGRMDNAPAGDLSFAIGSPAIAGGRRLYVASEGTMKEFDDYVAGGATSQRTHNFTGGVNNVFFHGGKLVLTNDLGVFIFNSGGMQENVDVFSSGIIGCGPNAMDRPQSAFITPAGHLIVADTFNNRVLIWNPEAMPSSGPLLEPSIVVGQRDKESCFSNETGESGPTESTLSGPRGVWSDGTRLVVVDSGNNRLLIWDQMPNDNFEAANHVVGQADFLGFEANRQGVASEFTLCGPESVDVNAAGQMAVADACNHRVLVWDAVPRTDSASANHVLGQNTFAGSDEPTAPTSQNLRFPTGARFHDRNLIVVDHGHSRVLVFPASN